jgi:DDE superfamily endonuclease
LAAQRRALNLFTLPPDTASCWSATGPDDDEAAVTAARVREVITRLVAAGHWREGDPEILVIFDADYDIRRLAYLLADLPAQVLGRLRSDRVMQLANPRAGVFGVIALIDRAGPRAPPILPRSSTPRPY